MDTFECIKKRLEVREYKPDPIPEGVINKILEAGRLSPSSRNRQPWHFIVVRDKGRIKSLGEYCTTGNYVGQAPLAVAIVADPSRPTYIIDVTRAVQDMMLAAWNEGVGSCWVGQVEEERIKELLKIPKEYQVLTVIPFGYPLRRLKGKKDRKKPEEVFHWEEFGGRS